MRKSQKAHLNYRPLVYVSFWMISLVIVLSQIFDYIQTGQWQAMSLIDFAALLTEEDEWITDPNRWLGIHHVLDSVPASIFFLIFGMLVYLNTTDSKES